MRVLSGNDNFHALTIALIYAYTTTIAYSAGIALPVRLNLMKYPSGKKSDIQFKQGSDTNPALFQSLMQADILR